MAAEAARSTILVIGGTGYIGKVVVAASVRQGHPTFALVRDPAPADPAKAELLRGFQDSGVTLLKGDLYEHESLVRAIKEVDVVISAVSRPQLADQARIIAAIKEAGNVKRFLPSEFGNDSDQTHAVDPIKSIHAIKSNVRRAIKAEGIPYTFVCSHFLAGYFLRNVGQAAAPPTDKVVIFGDGNNKAIFVDDDDVGTYVVRAVDDPRTLNKTLYLRPPANVLSHNELVSLWEKKTGKTLERVYLPEEEILRQIQEAPIPLNVVLGLAHSVYIGGDHNNLEIEPLVGVEASQLYPDVKYTTVDEYLDRLL